MADADLIRRGESSEAWLVKVTETAPTHIQIGLMEAARAIHDLVEALKENPR